MKNYYSKIMYLRKYVKKDRLNVKLSLFNLQIFRIMRLKNFDKTPVSIPLTVGATRKIIMNSTRKNKSHTNY